MLFGRPTREISFSSVGDIYGSKRQARALVIAKQQLCFLATKFRLLFAGGALGYHGPRGGQDRPGHDVSKKERHHKYDMAGQEEQPDT